MSESCEGRPTSDEMLSTLVGLIGLTLIVPANALCSPPKRGGAHPLDESGLMALAA